MKSDKRYISELWCHDYMVVVRRIINKVEYDW